MRYRSTGGKAAPATLAEAVWRGLAPDGGLYLPERIPRLSDGTWQALTDAALPEVATTVLAPYLEGTLDHGDLATLAADSFSFPIPLVPLVPDKNLWLLELFHGPTLAFKDVGARFLARLLPVVAPEEDRPITVLVATSGDTGGAVAQAFYGVEGTRVAVLYPHGQVSPRQERQFATLGGNVLAVAIDGTFDDCQRLAKEAFADRELCERLRLTSANSINLGRLLPQMVYYAHGASQLRQAGERRPPVFVVPSGNFGNLTAGLLAAEMGLPCHRPLIAACNANDVVPEYLESGIFRPRPSIATLANAMDVGNPSNLVRIQELFGDSIRRHVTASSFDDDAIRQAIREAYETTGRVLDPHTAVGWLGWRKQEEERSLPPAPAVILATAHPAKFAEVVAPEIGKEPPIPASLAASMDRPLNHLTAPPELSAVRDLLAQRTWSSPA